MAEYCSCAGSFATLTHITDYQRVIQIFENISNHFELKLLGELVAWTKSQM